MLYSSNSWFIKDRVSLFVFRSSLLGTSFCVLNQVVPMAGTLVNIYYWYTKKLILFV